MLTLRLCRYSYLTDTTITTTITACTAQLYAILPTTATLLFSCNFTLNWLNYYWLLPALSGCVIYTRLQFPKRSQSWMFMISPFREFYCESLCISILILVCPGCLLLLVYLERYSLYFGIVYILTLVAFVSSFWILIADLWYTPRWIFLLCCSAEHIW